jgi:hypothetical protein
MTRMFRFGAVLLAAFIVAVPLALAQNYKSEYKLSTVLPTSYP